MRVAFLRCYRFLRQSSMQPSNPSNHSCLPAVQLSEISTSRSSHPDDEVLVFDADQRAYDLRTVHETKASTKKKAMPRTVPGRHTSIS